MEPCGCDPRTDVGGVRRLSAVVSRYRNHFQELLILNLGNITVANENSGNSDAITKVIEIIKPEASLVNEYEWKRFSKSLRLADIPWVLSNAKASVNNAAWNEKISQKGYEIFGYLGVPDKSIERASPFLFAKWKKQFKSTSSNQRILLFSGTNGDLEKIVGARLFGIIVRSSQVPLGTEIGDQEQKNENSLARKVSGQLIWSVPFGGAGVMRLAGLEKSQPPMPLGSLLKERESLECNHSSICEKRDALASLISSRPIHWLRPDEESGLSADVVKIFDDLRDLDRNRFKNLALMRAKDLQNSEFVGAEACAQCHKSAYEVWKKSRHSSAITSLTKKKRHEDTSCVECHVLGFKAKGGYVNEDVTPHYSNVQCENCHGPRRAHVMSPTEENSSNSKVSSKKSCFECHTPPHSPGFDYSSYWKKIEHK